MLTRPVIFTEKLPALGKKGDIVLCDFSQYAIGIRREVLLDKSIHVGWATDSTGYRAIMRVDGAGTWSAPIQPKDGDTLSWCVTLAAR
jgi:HK97 family phage major capsid protein